MQLEKNARIDYCENDVYCSQDLGQVKMRNLNLGGHVGFDSLPDQLVNKAVAVGFAFNILCIGKL